MSDLLSNTTNGGGSVECLGLTFPDEGARREHFLKLLAEKLQDPAFRSKEGFPVGTDAAILALSDPPYYTACPNPFLSDFVKQLGTPYVSTERHLTEPLVADVKEGKNDPIYNAHSYHTKVPHRAIMRYILHYTRPGEVVLDSFCGTGMTGVAAQLCGDRRVVESLGYKVDPDGSISEKDISDGRTIWRKISEIGPRVAILNELSPAASFIAANYNNAVDVQEFQNEAGNIVDKVSNECGWMYETLHGNGTTRGRINFTLWSDVFNCSECAGEIVFWEAAADRELAKIRDDFECPYCSAMLKKRGLERSWENFVDVSTKENIRQAKQVPVLINYTVGSKRFEKKPDQNDLNTIRKVLDVEIPEWFPSDRMMDGGETRRNDPIGVTHEHHFYTRRNLIVLAKFRSLIFESKNEAARGALGLWFTSSHVWATRLNRLLASNYFGGGGGVIGQTLRGGSVCLNSVGAVAKWLPASVGLPSGLMTAH